MSSTELVAGTRLAAHAVALAGRAGVRIAVAESLTGGRLADALVSIPGVSSVFSGGVVAYDTAIKQSVLGVDDTLLSSRGPVDPEVAAQMAAGVRCVCATPAADGTVRAADIGVSTTGVAGPDPDPQSGQVPGTVWVAVDVAGVPPLIRGLEAERGGSAERSADDPSVVGQGETRSSIRDRAVVAALELLIDALEFLLAKSE